MQLGLVAVTEANQGDFTVKLKAKRSRSVDEVMADIRAQIKTTEPELDIELTQVLQDMINDLSNTPEPIQIKVFSNDTAALNQLGPESAMPSARSRALWTCKTASRTPSAVRLPTSRSIPLWRPARLHSRRSFSRCHRDSRWNCNGRPAHLQRSALHRARSSRR